MMLHGDHRQPLQAPAQALQAKALFEFLEGMKVAIREVSGPDNRFTAEEPAPVESVDQPDLGVLPCSRTPCPVLDVVEIDIDHFTTYTSKTVIFLESAQCRIDEFWS